MLNIKVNDTQKVVDTLEEAVSFVVQEITKWFNSDDQTPLQITITKPEDRAGPALNISIGEKLPTKEALG